MGTLTLRVRAFVWTIIVVAFVALVAWGAVNYLHGEMDFKSTSLLSLVVKWMLIAAGTLWITAAGVMLAGMAVKFLVESLAQEWRRTDEKPIGFEPVPRKINLGLVWLAISITTAAAIYACATRYSYYPSKRVRVDHWTGETVHK